VVVVATVAGVVFIAGEIVVCNIGLVVVVSGGCDTELLQYGLGSDSGAAFG
jgi:hypothetical protein